MFLHEAWVDITKEKPPNLFWRYVEEHGEGYSQYDEILILTKSGRIYLDTPGYLNEDEFGNEFGDPWGYENTNGVLKFYSDYPANVEDVTHWMLLDNLYQKGKA